MYKKPNNAIPWHLIGELYSNGKSIKELSERFNVPETSIKRRLDVAISHTGHIRSNAEINVASSKVKSDLITTLLNLVEMLKDKPRDELASADISHLEKLSSVAMRLFAWPAPKAIDTSGNQQSNERPTQAINLALIRTSPEELRELKKANIISDLPAA